MIELALPAGTIKEAITAFNAGADAVYFGMKEFSARKGAGNFSAEDLSRIRRFALENRKKIYITVNTLIDDSSLSELYTTLKTIDCYGCDGIIIQDLGVASIIKRDFPELPLHGSTQLAVHTVSGVKALQKIGFERVVLSRELNLQEIREIRKACPDIELKVFIHGALCYGFSGLCMASHLITGRSANEGSCAQICRSWFYCNETGERAYPFSLEDLDAGRLVRDLMDAGIDSLKVEGRLKGPEYVDAVTRYYRAIIDGKDEKPYKHAVAVSFQRKCGTGFLLPLNPNHREITTGPFPGHRGEEIGRVLDQRGRKLLVESERRIKQHDGLMVLLHDKGLEAPYRFPARVVEARGDRTILTLPDDTRLPSLAPLYMISDSSLNMKAISTSLPLMKKSFPASITVESCNITIEAGETKAEYEITTEDSSKSAIEVISTIFSQSGESFVQLSPIEIINRTGMELFYINPSRLKNIRRDFLEKLSQQTEDKREYKTAETEANDSLILPPRKLIAGKRTPWNLDGKEIDGRTYFSFPAVRYDEAKVFNEIEEKAVKAVNPVIGLNNIGDLLFCWKHPEYAYFADIYLYLANRETASLLKELVPSLTGGYLWLEREKYEAPWPFAPTIVKDYRPPLFISRACYRHDGLGLSCKDCTKHNTFHAEQNGRKYIIYSDDCNTIVCEEERERKTFTVNSL
ncbi:MAG: U32 family peptidase [Spirochaetes bacterium]|uniref:U32 family peptidase n=1 Tax=Candidatus Ornithospirochaeta stercoripullorum TaxID=2840899 RepID=A0A9D9H255_9SPIO|nr:U32 family peptidase [Candidatus Ornithospirochaeta stercoripullorum]